MGISSERGEDRYEEYAAGDFRSSKIASHANAHLRADTGSATLVACDSNQCCLIIYIPPWEPTVAHRRAIRQCLPQLSHQPSRHDCDRFP